MTRQELTQNCIIDLLSRVYDAVTTIQCTYDTLIMNRRPKEFDEKRRRSVFGSTLYRVYKEDFVARAFINVRWSFYAEIRISFDYDDGETGILLLPYRIVEMKEEELKQYALDEFNDYVLEKDLKKPLNTGKK